MALLISAIVASVALFTLASLQKKDNLVKGITLLQEDIISMRSRAISLHRTHRLRILSANSFVIQEYNTTTAVWSNISLTRSMPSGIVIRTYDVTNKPTSLEFDGTGLPNFNGVENLPFATVIESVTDDRKGLYIEAGGAISTGAGAADAT